RVGTGNPQRDLELSTGLATRRRRRARHRLASCGPESIGAWRRLLALAGIQPDLTVVLPPRALDADADLHRRAPAIIGRRATPQRALALVQRVGGRELRGIQGSPPEAQVP